MRIFSSRFQTFGQARQTLSTGCAFRAVKLLHLVSPPGAHDGALRPREEALRGLRCCVPTFLNVGLCDSLKSCVCFIYVVLSLEPATRFLRYFFFFLEPLLKLSVRFPRAYHEKTRAPQFPTPSSPSSFTSSRAARHCRGGNTENEKVIS